MTAILTAFAFLTRLPMPGRLDARLDRAATWFPLVGLAVGGIAAGVRALADLALPPLPATLLAVAAAVLVTGALHEDGWADVADGAGAHVDPERGLEILRDPRVGTFGALALILAVGLVVTTVGALGTADAAATLVLAHVLARWAILPVGLLSRPARDEGAGASLRVAPARTALATLMAALAAVALAGPAAGAAALLGALAAAALMAVVLRRRFGGITGDGYGATAKLAEIVTCCTLVAWWT